MKRGKGKVRVVYVSKWSRVNIPEALYQDVLKHLKEHPDAAASPSDFVNRCVKALMEKEGLEVLTGL